MRRDPFSACASHLLSYGPEWLTVGGRLERSITCNGAAAPSVTKRTTVTHKPTSTHKATSTHKVTTTHKPTHKPTHKTSSHKPTSTKKAAHPTHKHHEHKHVLPTKKVAGLVKKVTKKHEKH